jgi:hypothetical protein
MNFDKLFLLIFLIIGLVFLSFFITLLTALIHIMTKNGDFPKFKVSRLLLDVLAGLIGWAIGYYF